MMKIFFTAVLILVFAQAARGASGEHEFDAVLQAPFHADSKGVQLLTMRFAAPDAQTHQVRWRLELLPRHDETVVRTWRGVQALAGTPVQVEVRWRVKVATSVYRIRMRASLDDAAEVVQNWLVAVAGAPARMGVAATATAIAGTQADGANTAAARTLFQSGLQQAAGWNAVQPGMLAIYGQEWGVISHGGHLNILNADALLDLAFSSNQDNHCANRGAAYSNRTAMLLPRNTPLTAVTLLDALQARRVYATMDKHALLIFTAKHHLMGQRIRNLGKLILQALYTSGNGRSVASVSIFHGVPGQGQVAALASAAQRVTKPLPDEHFYYARVTQHDGKMLWSAPMWVTQLPP